jgi:uncharacterized protein YndB with AHSA1/START domain
MGHEFEVRKEIELDATPEQVWEAITTGPGIDAWFMGRTEVEPRQGGTARFTLAGSTEEATVTAWDPPKRFATRSAESDDGRFMAQEFLIEGRGQGGTVLRLVQSGVLGDDWETEYDALNEGWGVYLYKLAEYLKYFRGRTATPIFAAQPQAGDPEQVQAGFRRALGLADQVAEGEKVRVTPDRLAPLEGVVDYRSPTVLGLRTDDGLYRFMAGYDGTAVLGHHLFAEGVDQQATEQAWQAWLTRAFAAQGSS